MCVLFPRRHNVPRCAVLPSCCRVLLCPQGLPRVCLVQSGAVLCCLVLRVASAFLCGWCKSNGQVETAVWG